MKEDTKQIISGLFRLSALVIGCIVPGLAYTEQTVPDNLNGLIYCLALLLIAHAFVCEQQYKQIERLKK